jgi:hypothetical protein
MSTKSMTFQPAPRPQPRVSPEQTRELAEATRDLGFGRTTSTPEAEAPPESPQPAPNTAAVAPRAPRPSAKNAKLAKQVEPAAEPAAERMATLKFAMPDETWVALRHEALNRRVTVKYLVMEALAAKGYDVDMSKIAEDGRRLR